jgi:rRNA biogenesis protein RRP5
VVDCNPAARKVTLTMKKQLLKTDLPAISSLEDAKPGARAYGVVTGVKTYGVFVSFFGGVNGLIRSSDLGLKADEDPQVWPQPSSELQPS